MFRKLRPSPALVVASLALAVALGGTAFAGPVAHLAKMISGSTIRPRSIPGNRMRNDALTGKQIKESSLGSVPKATRATNATHAGTADSATNATTAANAANAANATNATHAGTADSATNATNAANATNATHSGTADSATNATNAATAANANAVGGITVRKVFYAPTTATPTPTTILSLGGLTLSASCNGGTIAILVTSAVDHSHFSSEMFNSGGGGQADGLHHTDFNTTSLDDLTDSNDWGETSFTYTKPDATIVNGQLSFDDSNIIGGNIFNHTAACLVSGFAMSTAAS
jgi:hypothetical protein